MKKLDLSPLVLLALLIILVAIGCNLKSIT